MATIEDVLPAWRESAAHTEWAEPRGDDWLFRVRDQGPGIPAAYHDRLFELFTRGPQRDEIEGTGVGLAVCKKAVADHHSRIWLESAPGEGATFWFTLPRRNGLNRPGRHRSFGGGGFSHRWGLGAG